MIKCICIDDKNKPKEIPFNKWIKLGNEYTISAVYHMVQPGAVMGVILTSPTLDETCHPYECFRVGRFAIRKQDIPALIELIENCKDLQEFDPMKLIEEEIGELLEI